MKRYLHWWVTLLFLLALAYDAIVWSAAVRIPVLGDKLHTSIRREGLLASIYVAIGTPVVSAVPALETFGEGEMQAAIADGIPRIEEDPSVGMDLIFSQNWNARHRTLKIMYWAAPVLLVLALIFWVRRPKKISLMGRR